MADIIHTVPDTSIGGGTHKIDIMLTTLAENDSVYIRRSRVIKDGVGDGPSWVAIDVDDIDDVVVALLYAKKIIIDRSWEPEE